jgi:hypothetical protein
MPSGPTLSAKGSSSLQKDLAPKNSGMLRSTGTEFPYAHRYGRMVSDFISSLYSDEVCRSSATIERSRESPDVIETFALECWELEISKAAWDTSDGISTAVSSRLSVC